MRNYKSRRLARVCSYLNWLVRANNKNILGKCVPHANIGIAHPMDMARTIMFLLLVEGIAGELATMRKSWSA